MAQFMKEQLALLSEYETIKSNVMFFSMDTILKFIVDFGFKDKNGSKKRAFEEFRYASTKYNNYDHLISSSIRFNPYLSIEYPNVNKNDKMKSHVMYLYPYSIEGLLDTMERFESSYISAFVQDKNGELMMKSSNVKTLVSKPSVYSTIDFTQDIYIDKDNNKDLGVRIGFNEEYYITVRYSTTFKAFKYYLRTCDLYGWGMSCIASYLNQLPGMAVSELDNGNYSSSSKYIPYWEDPDDIANNPESIKVNRTKPVTKAERQKSFFDEV